MIINTFANFADEIPDQLQNPYWFDSEWGWARPIRMTTKDGKSIRIIYYPYLKDKEMIIAKIAYREEDPYENGN